MARFWEKPRLRNENINDSRSATWLELFFDLAFVVAISVVGHELAKTQSIEGVFVFVALFVPLWWAWLGDAFYNNRFDPEDHGHQILSLLQMIGIVGLAIFAHNGLAEGFPGFALSFIWIRSILAILSIRAGRAEPKARKLMYYSSKVYIISIVFWFIAIFYEPPIRYILIGIGLAVDLIGPIFMAKLQRQVIVNVDHIIQRFGLFTVILLGEILLLSANATINAGTTIRDFALTAIGISIAFCLWWIYFENENGHTVVRNFFTQDGKFIRKNVIAGYVWLYSHLPFSMGLIATAVGMENIIAAGPDAMIAQKGVMLLTIGLMVVIFAIGLMELSAITCIKASRLFHLKLIWPWISIIAILVLTYSTRSSYPIFLLTGLFLITLAQVFVQEYIEHKLNLEKHHHH